MLKASLGVRLKQWAQKERPVLIASVSVTATILLLRLLGILQLSEFAALDQLFRLHPPEPPDDRIVIVEINEQDLKQAGKWPIPDKVMAQLLQKLNTYQPRAIGLDIYRDLPVEPGHREFVKVSETMPNLIGIEKLKDKMSTGVAPPLVLSQRQQVGFNNVVVDADGKVRRSLLYWHVNGEAHKSLALQLALVYLKAQGITPKKADANPEYLQLGQGVFRSFQPNDGGYVRANDKGYQVLVNFRRSAGFRRVSMADVLADRVNPSVVRSRIVLIGSTAPSLQDFFYTPHSSFT
jgi:CHASE2 domain-containing sensor protein